MVAGHSGCPSLLNNFIYTFHMPLFFVCSGYFFKEITSKSMLKDFCKRRIIRLYIPYIKWSFLFLILHNLFVYTYIIGFNTYKLEDYIRQSVKILFMADFELLIRPFWFVKELLFASIIVALLSFLNNKTTRKTPNEVNMSIMLFITLLFKQHQFIIPVMGDISIITLSTTYLYLGTLFRNYKDYIKPYFSFISLSFISTFIGSLLFNGVIDMRFTTIYNNIPFFFISIIGIYMTLCISTKLNSSTSLIVSVLYYIGNHTMPILTLNLLALKLGNLCKIWIYNLPIESLASYTIIYDYNNSFWIIYVFSGVSMPLLVDFLYFKYKRINITRLLFGLLNKK